MAIHLKTSVDLFTSAARL